MKLYFFLIFAILCWNLRVSCTTSSSTTKIVFLYTTLFLFYFILINRRTFIWNRATLCNLSISNGIGSLQSFEVVVVVVHCLLSHLAWISLKHFSPLKSVSLCFSFIFIIFIILMIENNKEWWQPTVSTPQSDKRVRNRDLTSTVF